MSRQVVLIDVLVSSSIIGYNPVGSENPLFPILRYA